MRIRRLAILLALCLAPLGAEVAVAHPSVPKDQLENDFLRHALLGRSTFWNGGVPVVLVLSRAEEDDEAMSRVSGRNLHRLLRGWKRLSFSGTGVMPLVEEDREAALERVAETRGAVTILALPPDEDLPEGLQRVDLAK